MAEGFLARLKEEVLLADGAMGTMLQPHLKEEWGAPEAANLHTPQVVADIHRRYAQAGAQVVLTNTFGGSRIRLARVGLDDKIQEVNAAAVRIAREAVGPGVLVAGDIGPTGELLEPLGELTYQQARDAFAEQAALLSSAGADLLVVETMSSLEEAKAALEGALSASSLPVVCTMSFDTNYHTVMGVSPEEAVDRLVRWGASVVGANCGVGPQETLEVVRRMHRAAPETPLAAQPNAGMPRLEGDRVVYDIGPEDMARFVPAFLAAGVRLLGSCCGSTPEHTGAMRRALEELGLR